MHNIVKTQLFDNQSSGYESGNKMNIVMELAMITQVKTTQRHCE